MKKTIYFDMDGTIANFYGVNNWLEMLNNRETTPYEICQPLVDTNRLSTILNELQKKGYRVGIISWGSKTANDVYLKRIEKAKRIWLRKHLEKVDFDEIHIIHYGTPKEIYKKKDNILFDDELKNRDNWGQGGYSEKEIFNILNELMK